jgi:hypothetical protein
MVLTIVKWIGIAMLLSLIALWLWQGGYWKIAEYAQVIPSPLAAASSSEDLYQLPGQPEFWEVPDTTSAEDEMEYGAADYEYASEPAAYDTALYPVPDSNRSPHNGYVRLQTGLVQSSDPAQEYVLVQAAGTQPVDISGWSLRSAFTGERRVIPLAAAPFIQGVVNSVRPVVLSPGDFAVVVSGASPVGVSFRESVCTGYLAQTQTFSPGLANACPRPAELLPRTPQNEGLYGSNCIDYVERLPQCSFPVLMPNTLSGSCRTHLSNTFSYTGCMQSYGARSMLNSWRIYLASGRELWRDSHDTIQLLDTEGRVVDTASY